MKLHPLFGKKSRGGKGSDESLERDDAFLRSIMSVPPGKISTYGKIAEAAGYPRYHRAVAQFLGRKHSDLIPWYRILGADGKLKTSGPSAKKQRSLLRHEGITFQGERVDMTKHLYKPGKSARLTDEE
jgi:methylated-DNA-protein-cysteine methyltransferase related protein